MLRRDFSAALLGAAALPLAPSLALAQGGPVEGTQYRRLSQALPTEPGKIEVVEFFWYGCPHCFVFDPTLEAWVKKLPADVAFRRVHVGFAALHKLHQKMFYALEAMGKEAEVHMAVFNAFHRERQDVSDEAAVMALMGRLGVDQAKFKAAFNSFSVDGKAKQATRLSENFKIDGVPALGIAGRYLTSPGMAGQPGLSEVGQGQRAVAVADYLIQLARKGV